MDVPLYISGYGAIGASCVAGRVVVDTIITTYRKELFIVTGTISRTHGVDFVITVNAET